MHYRKVIYICFLNVGSCLFLELKFSYNSQDFRVDRVVSNASYINVHIFFLTRIVFPLRVWTVFNRKAKFGALILGLFEIYWANIPTELKSFTFKANVHKQRCQFSLSLAQNSFKDSSNEFYLNVKFLRQKCCAETIFSF